MLEKAIINLNAREGEERTSGAPALRWPKRGDAGGITCSPSTRIGGQQRSAVEVRDEAGTAAARAYSGRTAKGEWTLEKWVHLIEASSVARGFGRQCSGEGDRQ
uniref:Uncharacterized protein n=1 Tax=Oryza glumipatula TaxID=40148 RepID=A0A0E0BJK4_9ORYZ